MEIPSSLPLRISFAGRERPAGGFGGRAVAPPIFSSRLAAAFRVRPPFAAGGSSRQVAAIVLPATCVPDFCVRLNLMGVYIRGGYLTPYLFSTSVKGVSYDGCWEVRNGILPASIWISTQLFSSAIL